MKKTLLLFSLVFVLLMPFALFGQGCALCYTQAAGSGAKMIAALKSGILVMMFPPMGICVFFTIMGYRKRNKFYELDSNSAIHDERGPNADLGW
jgi:energy-coupling factor transporter transmembrane protein EcfT